MDICVYNIKGEYIRKYTDVVLDTNTDSGVFMIYGSLLENKRHGDKLLFVGHLKNMYLEIYPS